jgi:hypothetical protein
VMFIAKGAECSAGMFCVALMASRGLGRRVAVAGKKT